MYDIIKPIQTKEVCTKRPTAIVGKYVQRSLYEVFDNYDNK